MLYNFAVLDVVEKIDITLSNDYVMIHTVSGKSYKVSEREDEEYGKVYCIADEIGIGMESANCKDLADYIVKEESL